MLNSFDDELVIAGYIEYGATSSWICQLDQRLVTQRILDRHRGTKIQVTPDVSPQFWQSNPKSLKLFQHTTADFIHS